VLLRLPSFRHFGAPFCYRIVLQLASGLCGDRTCRSRWQWPPPQWNCSIMVFLFGVANCDSSGTISNSFSSNLVPVPCPKGEMASPRIFVASFEFGACHVSFLSGPHLLPLFTGFALLFPFHFRFLQTCFEKQRDLGCDFFGVPPRRVVLTLKTYHQRRWRSLSASRFFGFVSSPPPQATPRVRLCHYPGF